MLTLPKKQPNANVPTAEGAILVAVSHNIVAADVLMLISQIHHLLV